MIRKCDEYGRETKEAETPEEYLLLEIERLKEENEMLRRELENCKDITNIQKDRTITIKQMVEEKNE